MIEKTARRTSKACDECNRRKVKCDGILPCATCTKGGKDCTYLNPNKRLRPKEVPETETDKRNSNLISFYDDEVSAETFGTTRWNHHLLYNYAITDKTGAFIPWIDVYYGQAHLLHPTIPRYVIDNYFGDLHLALLHAMLACCWPFSTLPFRFFEQHLNISKALKAEIIEPTTLVGILTELHFTNFYHWSGNISALIFSGTLSIRMAQLIGLDDMRDAPIVSVQSQLPLDLEVSRELGSRAYLYSYILDFYGRAIFNLPCFIRQPVKPALLSYFDMYGGKNSLYQYHSHLTIAKAYIPLITIGRKYYDLLDVQNSGKAFQISDNDLQSLLSELRSWRLSQPELDPVPDKPVMFLNAYSFWDSYMLLTHDFLSLLVLSKPFSLKILNDPLTDDIIRDAYYHANHTNKLIRGQLLHNPQFESMPALIGRCVFISGVVLCAFGYRDPEVIPIVIDHVTALLAIAEYASKAYMAVADQLSVFMTDPMAAIDYLQTCP